MPEGTHFVIRRSERKRVKIPVTLVVGSEDVGHAAMTIDLSSEGMRLQSDATLLPGQPVRLHLAVYPEHFVKARVAWVGKADSAEAGQAGFEFLIPDAGLAPGIQESQVTQKPQ